MNPTQTLSREEQELLIKLYGNRMEQQMNAGNRADALVWMDAMYEAINKRNAALFIKEAALCQPVI